MQYKISLTEVVPNVKVSSKESTGFESKLKDELESSDQSLFAAKEQRETPHLTLRLRVIFYKTQHGFPCLIQNVIFFFEILKNYRVVFGFQSLTVCFHKTSLGR